MLSQMSQFSIIRETPGESQPFIHKKPQKPSELKFKIEPIGVQPEDDDDLETCPSRTRSNWPHQINPWWKPADRFEKPPYSYATLIAHAILTSKDGRLTLSDIYKWISEAYPYYKLGQKGWQNSIRHNLSLNKKWFIKVDRRPTQAHPGKGGYWTLQMNMEKVFVDNLCQAGGHSRRHPDMNMYFPQHYTSTPEEPIHYTECPNIHITRPEDFQVKKSKSNVPAPRIRNMSCSKPVEAHPQTDGKQLTIRFSPSDHKRKRPPPKKGKKHTHVPPGSSTMEDDDDSAVDVGSFDQVSKKSKTTTTTTNVDTITASPSDTMVTPSDVIGSMPYMLLTSSLDYQVIQAQNILDGLTSCQEPEMKTIDLQGSLEKTLHFSNDFDIQDLSDPSSKLFIPELTTYNFDQYVDFSSAFQPSDVLLEQDNNGLDIFWPDTSNDCFMDFNL